MSSETKWTPGKWIAHKHGARSLAWRITLTPGDAHGDLANVLAGLGARSPDEVAANARLMAAVPVMREALVQAEACMSIVTPRSDKAEYLRILGVVRAALAAADGDER